MRKILGWLLGGALVGVLVASFSVMRWLPWYNQPGQGEQTLCDMKSVTERIVGTVFHVQLVGAAIGAAVGVVIAILLIVRASKRGKLAPPASPPASASRPG